MDEPPKLEEPLDESDTRVKRLKEQDGALNRDDYNLEERFYRYGVRPEWLVVHRVINHRLSRDGRATYLVKWRELGYDQATWEDEHEDIPGLKQAIEYYLDLRAANCCDGSTSRKGKKGEKSRLIYFFFSFPIVIVSVRINHVSCVQVKAKNQRLASLSTTRREHPNGILHRLINPRRILRKSMNDSQSTWIKLECSCILIN